MDRYYVYYYLDLRKPSNKYEMFKFEPFYKAIRKVIIEDNLRLKLILDTSKKLTIAKIIPV